MIIRDKVYHVYSDVPECEQALLRPSRGFQAACEDVCTALAIRAKTEHAFKAYPVESRNA